MIWDVHCHLSGALGRTPDERMARLIRYADRMDIERLTIFMGWPFVQRPSAENLREQNDQVIQALAHWHDRAFGFVYLSPEHILESLTELDRCVRDGPLVGVKLWVATRSNSEKLDPLIRRAVQLGAPILQHTWSKATGNLAGESTPSDLAALALRHPDAQFICGHAGGDWKLGIRSVRALPNVSIELGGFDPTAGVVAMAVRELGPRRILFGSDAGGRSFASQLAKVEGADVLEADKRLILAGNLRRILRPILR